MGVQGFIVGMVTTSLQGGVFPSLLHLVSIFLFPGQAYFATFLSPVPGLYLSQECLTAGSEEAVCVAGRLQENTRAEWNCERRR
jgi:hypothetical protein